tara:strand:+ start:258 stop:464 length:207 start_codon:yes stop_codon:yes gene_type:complete
MSIQPRHFIHPLGDTKRYSCWDKRCRKNKPNLVIKKYTVCCLNDWCNAISFTYHLENHPYFKNGEVKE